MSHPNVRGRAPSPTGDVIRVMVFAPDPTIERWIEGELTSRGMTWQVGRTVEHVVAGLVEDPPPRAQVLVADFDAMSALDVLRLHSIREDGWFGILIGLGEVTRELRTSLRVEHVLRPPHVQGALADVIGNAKLTLATTKIPTIR
jgi:hypothetical protein